MEAWIIFRSRRIKLICVLKLWVTCTVTTMALYLSLQIVQDISTRNEWLLRHYGDNQRARLVSQVEQEHMNQTSSMTAQSLWVVIDATTLKECNLTKKFSASSEWSLVIVSTNVYHISWCRSPSCFLLTPKDCKHHLSSWATSSLPSCPSRLTGFLYAISKGATTIFSPNCADSSSDTDLVYNQCATDHPSGLLYNSPLYFDVDDYVSSHSNGGVTCKSTSHSRSHGNKYLIQQFQRVELLEIVPFQERQPLLETSKKNILSSLPLIITGFPTFALLSDRSYCLSGSSLLWIYTPPDVPGWFASVFRSIWLNSIKRYFDINIGYFPVAVGKGHNSSHSCPLEKVIDMGEVLANKAIVDCVKDLACEDVERTNVCVVSLALDTFTCLRPLVADANVNISYLRASLTAWVDDFVLVSGNRLSRVLQIKSQERQDFLGESVQLVFGKSLTLDLNLKPIYQNGADSVVVQYMKKVCPRLDINVTTTFDRWLAPAITDIVLVILMEDENLAKGVPYLEYVHRQYFLHIVYCVLSGNSSFEQFVTRLKLGHISYITGHHNNTMHTYSCLSHVMRLSLPVKGYLLIHQNVLLNTWKLLNLSRDRLWFPQGFSKLNIYKTKSYNLWAKWNNKSDKESLMRVFSQLHSEASNISEKNQKGRKFSQIFLNTYFDNLQTDYLLSSAVNLVYIPDQLREVYLTAAEMFSRANVSNNIAFPALHFGLAPSANVTYLPSSSLSGEDRNYPWNYFSHFDNYAIYPLSLDSHLASSEGRQFFCRTFLSELDSIFRTKPIS
ncbi:glycosyltransferase STELLO1 [Biomphalaria glabrata]|nr:hypothetical protein BgiMline_020247 [Biomphalaria glabrata]